MQLWGEVASALEASVTVIAILVGGVWTYILFVRRRQKYPRANVTLIINTWRIEGRQRLLHLGVQVENVGDTLIELKYGTVRIQQLLPIIDDAAATIACGRDPVPANECEVPWPLLCERACPWEKVPREIEPGETDAFHFDFVIPDSVSVLGVYTYLRNVRKAKRNVGWNATSIYNVTDVD